MKRPTVQPCRPIPIKLFPLRPCCASHASKILSGACKIRSEKGAIQEVGNSCTRQAKNVVEYIPVLAYLMSIALPGFCLAMFFSPPELRRALEAAEVPAEPGDGRAGVPRRGAAAVRRRELHGQAPLLRRKGRRYTQYGLCGPLNISLFMNILPSALADFHILPQYLQGGLRRWLG